VQVEVTRVAPEEAAPAAADAVGPTHDAAAAVKVAVAVGVVGARVE
jgi:hypothetical protein